MKLRVLSDLHMEGHKFTYEPQGEEVLVLAGDIHTRNRHHEILDQVPPHIQVILVAGNHEYYHGNFQAVNKYLEELTNPDVVGNCYPNVHFLNNSSVVIDDICFFGGTMFTDFLLYGEAERWFAEHDANRYIADFHHIEVDQEDPYQQTNEKWQWSIQDHKDQYVKFNKEFDRWVKDCEGKTRVCVSHFMPSEMSIAPRWKNGALNPYFAVNNENRVQLVDLWIHGHTHDSFDYMLGDTRVVCNPKGYGAENDGGFNQTLIVEI